MIKAGKLIHRIELKNPTETKNSIGEVTTSYSSIGKVWARVFEKLNRETTDLVVNPGTKSTATFEITVRANDDITTATQIVYSGRTLGIVSLAQMEDRTGLLITAQGVA